MKTIAIRQLMFVVFMVAVISALSTRPTQAGSSVIISLTVFFLAIAALQACVRRDNRRAAWTGFAIFGWAYVLVGVGPKFDCLDSPMLTNLLLKEAFLFLVNQNPATMTDEAFINTYQGRALEFFQIGHSVFALLSGVIGAMCAITFNHESSDANPDPDLRAR
jgi:hypothetical protein